MRQLHRFLVLFVEIKISLADILKELLNKVNNARALFLAEEGKDVVNKTECLRKQAKCCCHNFRLP